MSAHSRISERTRAAAISASVMLPKYPRLQYRPAHQTRAWNGRRLTWGQ
jgi:hypothetical protein